jgi:hypothetical protein
VIYDADVLVVLAGSFRPIICIAFLFSIFLISLAALDFWVCMGYLHSAERVWKPEMHSK